MSKRYLFIGDSYAAGWSHDELNEGWPVYLAEIMSLEENEYLIKAEGGIGFGNGRILEAVNEISGEEDITDVILCGGYNDVNYTDAQIVEGMEDVVDAINEKWNDVNIYIGFIANIKHGNGTGAISAWERYRINLMTTVLTAWKKCTTLGCDYLPYVEYALTNAGLTPSDGYHPNETGNRTIAKAINNALTGISPFPKKQYMLLKPVIQEV